MTIYAHKAVIVSNRQKSEKDKNAVLLNEYATNLSRP